MGERWSWVGIFALLFLFLLGVGLHLFFRWELNHLQQERQKLLLSNALLAKKITRLEHNPSAYEEVARQKYGLIKPNERLIIFE